MKRKFKIKKSNLIWLGVIVLGALALFLGLNRQPLAPKFDTVTVSRQTVNDTVAVTGKLTPAQTVDLAFERSGRVVLAHYQVGNIVARGTILAALDTSELLSERAQASARLESAKSRLEQQQAVVDNEAARLAEIQRGPTTEETRLSESKLARAQNTLNDAHLGLVENIADAFFRSDDAVRSKADAQFTDGRGNNPQLAIVITNSQLEIDLEWARFLLEETLTRWQNSGAATSEIVSLANLKDVADFLTNVALALNSAPATASHSQATLDAYKLDIAAARTSINAATSALVTASEKLRAAESNVVVAQRELELTKAGSSIEQVAAQQAKLRQAQALLNGEKANVNEAQAGIARVDAQISKTTIVSPFAGTITFRQLEVGEIVAANAKALTVLATSGLQIEAFIPETDIVKINRDNVATFVVDALPNGETFEASVLKIDPAETVIEGVTTYKVTFTINNHDVRLKSGMTADLSILTQTAPNALTLPRRALINRDGSFLVLVPAPGPATEPLEKPVHVGLFGSDGFVEIIDGVEEGQTILLSK